MLVNAHYENYDDDDAEDATLTKQSSVFVSSRQFTQVQQKKYSVDARTSNGEISELNGRWGV